jgi:hypothetical protein
MKDAIRTDLSRSARYRDIAGALRALLPKLKQAQSRRELQQLAQDYERLAQFTQSVAASESQVNSPARHPVWIIVTDNSLDN